MQNATVWICILVIRNQMTYNQMTYTIIHVLTEHFLKKQIHIKEIIILSTRVNYLWI